MKSVKDFVKEHKKEVIIVGATTIIVGGIAFVINQHTKNLLDRSLRLSYIEQNDIDFLSSMLIAVNEGNYKLDEKEIEMALIYRKTARECKNIIKKAIPKLVNEIETF